MRKSVRVVLRVIGDQRVMVNAQFEKGFVRSLFSHTKFRAGWGLLPSQKTSLVEEEKGKSSVESDRQPKSNGECTV